jgi:hypothetical protein
MGNRSFGATISQKIHDTARWRRITACLKGTYQL